MSLLKCIWFSPQNKKQTFFSLLLLPQIHKQFHTQKKIWANRIVFLQIFFVDEFSFQGTREPSFFFCFGTHRGEEPVN